MTEHQLQAKCYLYFHNTYPKYRKLLFHVNNKAKNAFEGNKFKSLGVTAGIPDILYAFRGRLYGLEFKTEDGVLSPDQKLVHSVWQDHGFKIYVCRSFDQFKSIIEEIHNGSEAPKNVLGLSN